MPTAPDNEIKELLRAANPGATHVTIRSSTSSSGNFNVHYKVSGVRPRTFQEEVNIDCQRRRPLNEMPNELLGKMPAQKEEIQVERNTPGTLTLMVNTDLDGCGFSVKRVKSFYSEGPNGPDHCFTSINECVKHIKAELTSRVKLVAKIRGLEEQKRLVAKEATEIRDKRIAGNKELNAEEERVNDRFERICLYLSEAYSQMK